MPAKKNKTLEAVFLGTGTSVGIPVPSCRCAVCRSDDALDKRWRSSLLIRAGKHNIVIDTGPEFRLQCLRHNVSSLSAILLTHNHADHLNGLDDVRAFTIRLKNTRSRTAEPIPVYGNRHTLSVVKKCFGYIWHSRQEGGGLPRIELRKLVPLQQVTIEGIAILPIPLKHGIMDILGYRIGDFAYMTDISALPPCAEPYLHNLKTMVVSCVKHTRHETHFSLGDVKRLHARLQPQQTYITHISHYFSHKKLRDELPVSIRPAFDGMSETITC